MTVTIGIVAGLGTEGTVNYYRKLARHFAAVPREQRPRFVLEHLWFDEFVDKMRSGSAADVGKYLSESLERLHRAGAQLAIIASITPHKFLPQPLAAGVEVLDIVEATIDGIREAGLRKVGIVGTRATCTEPFFRGRLEGADIRVVAPDEQGLRWLDELIFAAVKPTAADIGRDFSALLGRMQATETFDTLVVACTDLMDHVDPSINALDPIDCHLQLAARRAAALSH